MKLSGIFKYALSLMYRKKLFMIIEMYIIAISMSLITQAYMNYYLVNEEIISVKGILEVDLEKLYSISFDDRGMYSEEAGTAIYEFSKEFVTGENADASSVYYYDSIMFYEADMVCGAPVLFINQGAFRLHNLKNINGEKITINEGEIVVGYKHKDSMPIGSSWKDETGKEYIVKDILAEGEQWYGSQMLGNEEFLLCLDEHYVMNVAFNHNTDPYYGFVFQNGIYFVANKKQYKELEAYITEISNSNNCPVTIYPSEKIFKDYINTYNEYYYVTTFQTVLKLILSFLGLFIASVVSLLKQRDTLMIMYRYGVSRKEHVIIHAVSNVIKCVIAMSASYSLMFIRCFNMAYNKLVYFKEMVVVSVLTVIAAVIFVEIVTDILLLKYLNEVNKSE